MRIDKTRNSVNFNGVPSGIFRAAARDGSETVLQLYKITHKDRPFLLRLADEVDVGKLRDGFTKKEYEVWNGVIRSGLIGCGGNERGYLLAKDNIPCGVMRYQPMPNKIFVQDVATWGVEKNKKVPFAGKVLFMQLFSDFMSGLRPLSRIELCALKDSPYTPVFRYMKLGFKSCGGCSIYYEEMRILKSGIEKSLNELKSMIKFTPETNPKEVDFNKILKIKKD